MLNFSEEDPLYWFVIHTHPKQENRADSNLRAHNVETFFPTLNERRYGSKSGERQFERKPLFPRYIFARFKAVLLNQVRYTRGVDDVVSFGGRPAPVSNEIISMLRSRVGYDGAIMMNTKFKPDSELIVKEGPFKNLMGIFEGKLNGTNRVILLLQHVNYQSRVVVEHEYVSKL